MSTTLTLTLTFLFLLLSASVSGKCTTTTATKTFEKCISLPTQQASIAWTYHPHNATLDLCFFGTFISPSGWVGWGINPDTPSQMTGSRVLIAFPDPNSGQLILLPYVLDSSVKLQKGPLLSRPLDILRLSSSSASLYGGNMATIRNGASVQIYASVKLSSNNTKIHHVWNRGLYVQGYSPTIHPTASTDLSSFSTFDVTSGIVISFFWIPGGSGSKQVISHGQNHNNVILVLMRFWFFSVQAFLVLVNFGSATIALK